MILLISPAKTLDFKTNSIVTSTSKACFIEESDQLAKILQSFMPKDIKSLMGVSDKIADLNYERYQQWFEKGIMEKAAVYAFKGDVYAGLDVDTLKNTEYMQGHLRILSGIYGYLKPLDLMKAYRLEMGSKLSNPLGKDLYEFWGNIADMLLNELESHRDKHIINLASNEYFKSVKSGLKNQKIITPVFKENKNGDYRIISFFAKKARGLMSRYIIENNLQTPEGIKGFNYENYSFNEVLSNSTDWVFTR